MRQVVFVNEKNRFDAASNAQRGEFLSHSLESGLHGAIALVQRIFRAEGVVRQRVGSNGSFQRGGLHPEAVIVNCGGRFRVSVIIGGGRCQRCGFGPGRADQLRGIVGCDGHDHRSDEIDR